MKPTTVNISFNKDIKKRSYDIQIGTDLLTNAGLILRKFIENRKVIVIHDNYFSLNENDNEYFYKFAKSIEANCKNIFFISVRGGDKTKNIIEFNEIIGKMLSFEIDRESLVIAFGGGVVGDIAGFASSVVLRGINFIQVPTTLLSQVDSSVGGKPVINPKMGKNLIVPFHHPFLVISVINILDSLPKTEFFAG